MTFVDSGWLDDEMTLKFFNLVNFKFFFSIEFLYLLKSHTSTKEYNLFLFVHPKHIT